KSGWISVAIRAAPRNKLLGAASEALHGVRAHALDRLHEVGEQAGQPVGLGDRDFHHLHALGLEGQATERLAHVVHPRVEELAAADEVTLVILAGATAEQRDAVE